LLLKRCRLVTGLFWGAMDSFAGLFDVPSPKITHKLAHTHTRDKNRKKSQKSQVFMSDSITFHCVSSPVFSRYSVWFPRKNRKKSQVLMSDSITFHCVYFGLSTVPISETIEGSRSRKSSPVVSRYWIWFPSKKSPKIAINRKKSIRLDRLRFFPKWKNRFKGNNSHWINRCDLWSLAKVVWLRFAQVHMLRKVRELE